MKKIVFPELHDMFDSGLETIYENMAIFSTHKKMQNLSNLDFSSCIVNIIEFPP